MPDIHVAAMDGYIHPLVTAGVQQIAPNTRIKQSPVELFLPFGVQLRWVEVVEELGAAHKRGGELVGDIIECRKLIGGPSPPYGLLMQAKSPGYA